MTSDGFNKTLLGLGLCGVLLTGCDNEPDEGDAEDTTTFETGWREVEELEEELLLQQTKQELRELAACYGVGHDLLFLDLGGPQTASLEVLRQCFSDDVHTDVIFFGGEPTALDGLPGLVSFVETFALDSGYHTARNTPGNVGVELLSDEDAIVTSSGATPHFSLASAESPFVDWITAKYTHVAHLEDDGWKTTTFTIEIEEVAHVGIAYPLGQ